MKSEIFVGVMKHYFRRWSSSKDKPSLQILENHESHTTETRWAFDGRDIILIQRILRVLVSTDI
jgi:hypothetical protein